MAERDHGDRGGSGDHRAEERGDGLAPGCAAGYPGEKRQDERRVPHGALEGGVGDRRERGLEREGRKAEQSPAEEGGNPPPGEGGGKAYTAKGNEGTITGKISYTGAAPEPKKIDTSADANCKISSPFPSSMSLCAWMRASGSRLAMM